MFAKILNLFGSVKWKVESLKFKVTPLCNEAKKVVNYGKSNYEFVLLAVSDWRIAYLVVYWWGRFSRASFVNTAGNGMVNRLGLLSYNTLYYNRSFIKLKYTILLDEIINPSRTNFKHFNRVYTKRFIPVRFQKTCNKF